MIFGNLLSSMDISWPVQWSYTTQLNEHLWTQVLIHYLVIIAYRYYNQLISRTDLSPIPVRSASKSYITPWCIQNLSKRVLNRQTVSTSTTKLDRLFQILTIRAEKEYTVTKNTSKSAISQTCSYIQLLVLPFYMGSYAHIVHVEVILFPYVEPVLLAHDIWKWYWYSQVLGRERKTWLIQKRCHSRWLLSRLQHWCLAEHCGCPSGVWLESLKNWLALAVCVLISLPMFASDDRILM